MSLSATERAAWHISRERKSRRWRLEDLAQRVTGHGVPMTLNTLSKVERGVRGISVEELEAIAAALGIEIEALLADPTRGRNATTNAGVAAVNEAVDAYERGELTLDEMNEAVEKGLKRVAADALRDIDDLAARALRGDPPRHPLEPTEPAPAAWYQDQRDPSLMRFWDGERWTQQTRPLHPEFVEAAANLPEEKKVRFVQHDALLDDGSVNPQF